MADAKVEIKNPTKKADAKPKAEELRTPKQVTTYIAAKFPGVTKFDGQTKLKMKQEPKYRIPTGIVPLDAILDGGFPTGRYTVIFGPESTFKSSLGYQGLENNLWAGNVSMLYDNEHAYDQTKYHLTEFPDQFLYKQQNELESFYEGLLEKLDIIQESKLATAVVWDSIPVTRSKGDLTSKIGDKSYGGAGAAAIHTQAIPRLLNPLEDSNCALIIVNQVRDVMGDVNFGEDPYDMPGGWAIKYYAALILKTEKRGGAFRWVTDSKGDPDGYHIQVTITKNKVGTPLRKVLIPIIFTNNMGGDPAMAMFQWLSDNKQWESTAQGRYKIKGFSEACLRRDFPAFYVQHFDNILAFFKEQTGFEYSPEMKKAVFKYTVLRDGPEEGTASEPAETVPTAAPTEVPSTSKA